MTAEMETEKQVCRSGTSRVIVTSWAAVATALFLFTLVFGAFYVSNVKLDCDRDGDAIEDNTESIQDINMRLQDGGREQIMDLHENKEDNTDHMVKRNSEGNIELIVGIDYNKKISTAYLPREDICVLATGENMHGHDQPGEEIDLQDMQPQNHTFDDSVDSEVTYQIDMANKVADEGLLTPMMQIICHGKPMYWASESDSSSVDQRQKRGSCGCMRWYYFMSICNGYSCRCYRCQSCWFRCYTRYCYQYASSCSG